MGNDLWIMYCPFIYSVYTVVLLSVSFPNNNRRKMFLPINVSPIH